MIQNTTQKFRGNEANIEVGLQFSFLLRLKGGQGN